MSWHQDIDASLAEFSARPRNPDNLAISEPLREALLTVEESLTADPVTLRVVQAMADCAIEPMVTDLAETGHPYLDQLVVLRNWSECPPFYRAGAHSTLTRVATYYRFPGGVEASQGIWGALSMAASLMERAYPIDYTDRRLVTSPIRGNMLHVVNLFAVTSHVHTVECGEDKNQAAVEALAQTITRITATE